MNNTIDEEGINDVNEKNNLDFTDEFSNYFEPTDSVRKHMLGRWIFNDQITGRATCSICKVSYNTKVASDSYKLLLNHLESKHLKIQAYPCHYCERSFFSKHQRTRHYHKSHRGEHKQATEQARLQGGILS
jgi:hypothetical protein